MPFLASGSSLKGFSAPSSERKEMNECKAHSAQQILPLRARPCKSSAFVDEVICACDLILSLLVVVGSLRFLNLATLAPTEEAKRKSMIKFVFLVLVWKRDAARDIAGWFIRPPTGVQKTETTRDALYNHDPDSGREIWNSQKKVIYDAKVGEDGGGTNGRSQQQHERRAS